MSKIPLDQVDRTRLTRGARWTLSKIVEPMATEQLPVTVIAKRLGLDPHEAAAMVSLLAGEVRAQQKGAALPDLPPDEYAALKKNVRQIGILEPVVRNKRTGKLLDGNHRTRIAEELRIDLPEVEVDLPEELEHDTALALNLARRQLTREQMQKVIEHELMRDPQLSDNTLAKRLGVDHKTVGAARRRLVKDGVDIGNLPKRDSLGRVASPGRPSRKQAAPGSAAGSRKAAKIVATQPSSTQWPTVLPDAKLLDLLERFRVAWDRWYHENPGVQSPLGDSLAAQNKLLDLIKNAEGTPGEIATIVDLLRGLMSSTSAALSEQP